MLTEAELLQYIYQTTEMGRDGIQSVLPRGGRDPCTRRWSSSSRSMKSSTAPPERCCGNVIEAREGSTYGQGILRDDERDENHG